MKNGAKSPRFLLLVSLLPGFFATSEPGSLRKAAKDRSGLGPEQATITRRRLPKALRLLLA
jgi:hypothetical protein